MSTDLGFFRISDKNVGKYLHTWELMENTLPPGTLLLSDALLFLIFFCNHIFAYLSLFSVERGILYAQCIGH